MFSFVLVCSVPVLFCRCVTRQRGIQCILLLGACHGRTDLCTAACSETTDPLYAKLAKNRVEEVVPASVYGSTRVGGSFLRIWGRPEQRISMEIEELEWRRSVRKIGQ